MTYRPIDSSAAPPEPPLYEHIDGYRQNPSIDIQQFEIEEGIDNEAPRPSLLRTSLKKLSNFRSSIMQPMAQMIDPIYEGYKSLSMQYENFILKLGNPLIVKRLLYVFFIVVFILILTKNDSTGNIRTGGFSQGSAFDINALSNSLESFIDRKIMKEQLEYFSSMPHLAGTKGDLTLAKYIESYMKSNGITHIDFNEVSTNINYPQANDNFVKLGDWQATLREGKGEAINNYGFNPNAMNSDGVIRGHYLNANYGTKEDFEKLKKESDLQNSIVLVKYGGKGAPPESNKVRYAQDHGVAALIFISDEFTVDGERHPEAIQRINVGLERFSTGDVLTPGWSSGEGYVTRLPWFKSECTAKIPTIPISAQDGKYLLDKLETSKSKRDTKRPKLEIKVTNNQKAVNPIWNVVGSIEGREQSDKGIIIGASRDSTCYGTIQSNTGSVVLLELIKLFTSLQRKYNWLPARSIYFVSFDATEYNIAGSTEWIESKRDLVEREGYTYIDLSDIVSGDKLEIRGHPLLHETIKDALGKVKLNENESLLQLFKNQNGNKVDISNDFLVSKNYIPFINLLNTPSIEIKFTGEQYPKGSCLDNFKHFESSGIDPDLNKLKSIVELIARIALNLAESPFIPFNMGDLTQKLIDYERDLEKFISEINVDKSNSHKPNIRFNELINAIEVLKDSSKQLSSWIGGWKNFLVESGGMEPSYLAMSRWQQNNLLVGFNSWFIIKNVKSMRPGYNNLLFGVPFDAPTKLENGDKYEWNTFPSIRDYAMKGEWSNVQRDINVVSNMIKEASRSLLVT